MSTLRNSAGPVPKEWISAIAAYVPGKAKSDDGREVIKLSANENPAGTGEAARHAFAQAGHDLAAYPDPGAAILREAIAKRHGLDPARVIYGTGSDELLHIAASAYAGPGDEIIYVRYGFAVYDIAARRVGAVPVIAPDKDYGTDVDALLACVTDKTKVVFLANPNNPTGTMTPRAEIARLHAALPSDVLFVLDQAYAEYLTPEEDDGGLELAANASNVLVTRTFSKIHGLATAGQAAAAAAIADVEWVEACRESNSRERDRFSDAMSALGNHGISVVPSKANFLLVLFEGALSAEQAYQGLMAAGYAVRWLPGQGLPNALRITIGTQAQMGDVARIVREMAESAG